MNQYSEGQRVMSRYEYGALIVARTDPYGVFAMATTDGQLASTVVAPTGATMATPRSATTNTSAVRTRELTA